MNEEFLLNEFRSILNNLPAELKTDTAKVLYNAVENGTLALAQRLKKQGAKEYASCHVLKRHVEKKRLQNNLLWF